MKNANGNRVAERKFYDSRVRATVLLFVKQIRPRYFRNMYTSKFFNILKTLTSCILFNRLFVVQSIFLIFIVFNHVRFSTVFVVHLHTLARKSWGTFLFLILLECLSLYSTLTSCILLTDSLSYNVSSYLLHLIYIVCILCLTCKYNLRFINSNVFDQQFTLHIVRVICTFIYIYRATFIIQIRYNFVRRFSSMGVHRMCNVSKNWWYLCCYNFHTPGLIFETGKMFSHRSKWENRDTHFPRKCYRFSLEALKNFFPLSTRRSKLLLCNDHSKIFRKISLRLVIELCTRKNDENSTEFWNFFNFRRYCYSKFDDSTRKDRKF